MNGNDSASRDDSSRPRAFVVDDDPLTREIIAAHLDRLGLATVEVEPTRADIAEVIGAAGPDDVMILDVILGPDLDGFEVIRMLGHGAFRGRLVVVSGFGEDYLQTLQSLASALSIRVAGAIEKPVRPAALERCLKG